MTWTFTVANPGATSRDLVRLKIGDIDSGAPAVSDEIIAAYLSSEGSVHDAAIACCKHLIAKFARQVAQSKGGFSSSRNQKIEHFEKVLAILESDPSPGVRAFAGGISDSENDVITDDSDAIVPGLSFSAFDHK